MTRYYCSDRKRLSGYYVLLGPQGVGKTCLAKTAVHRLPGVFQVYLNQYESSNEIVNYVLRELTGIESLLLSPIPSAKRTIFLPEVVDLSADKMVNGLVSAVRTLTEDYHLKVIVDWGSNTRPDALLSTYRQSVIYLDPLPESLKWNNFKISTRTLNPLPIFNIVIFSPNTTNKT
jgi:GTPase SAR1 family protein